MTAERPDGGPIYAQGGLIPPGVTKIQLSRGCVFVSHSHYQELGRETLQALYPDSDIEVVFSAKEVREFSKAALEKLNEKLDGETA